MPIKVNDSTILDDDRNLVDAGIGTFTKSLTVGVGQSVVFIDSRASNDNVLSIRNSSNNSAFEVTGVGSVGIGISNPSTSLHIIGSGLLVSTAVGTSEMFSVSTRASNDNVVSVRNNSDSSAFEVTGVGSVGIGISNPTRALHINGSGVLVSNGSTEFFSVEAFSSNPNIFEVKTGSNSNAFVVTGLSSVGVGVENPTRALHINGSGVLVSNGSTEFFSVEAFSSNPNIFEVKNISNNNLFFVNNSSVGFGSTNVLTMTPQATRYSLGVGGSEVVRFAVGTTSQNSFSVLSSSGALTYFNVMNSGFVGIGTTNPSQKLHVDGGNLLVTNGGTTIISAGATTTGNVFTVQKRTSSPAFDITGIGSVGIGTTNPSGVFEVNSGSRSLLIVRDTGGTTNAFQVLNNNNQAIFGVSNTNVGIGSTNILTITPQGTQYSIGIAGSDVVRFSAISTISSENVFSVLSPSGALNYFTVTRGGSVGVGTTNPSQKLHVEGGSLLVTNGGTTVISAGATTTGNAFSVQKRSLSPGFDITGLGSVGIGTASPSGVFEVNSGSKSLMVVRDGLFSNAFQVLNNNNQTVFGVTNSSVGIGSTSILTITPQGTVYSVGIATEEIVTLARNTGSNNIFSVTNAQNTLTHLTVSSAGLVGLGTTNPSQRLHVEGNLLVTDGGTEVFSAFKTGTNTLSVVNQSLSPAFDITGIGSVGIGTTQPSSNFQIVSAGSELFSVSSSTGNLLEVGTSSTAFSPPRIFVVTSTGGVGIATTSTTQPFQVGSGSSVVVIDNMGELGIGITNPRVALDVVGSANISGVTTLGLTASTAPTVNSTMSFELTNDTTLTVRVKGSDGTTRTGTITLS